MNMMILLPILVNFLIMAGAGMVIIPENLHSPGTLYLGYFMGLTFNTATYYAGQILTRMRHAQPRYNAQIPWLLFLYIVPAFIIPVFLIPYAIGNYTLLIGSYLAGQLGFSLIYLTNVLVQKKRASGERRFVKWYYFIPLWMYLFPAIFVGWFIIKAYHTDIFWLRVGNAFSLLMAMVFYYITLRMPAIDLLEKGQRKKIPWLAHLPFLVVTGIIFVVTELALPAYQGKIQEIFLLYLFSLYGICSASLTGVIIVTWPYKL